MKGTVLLIPFLGFFVGHSTPLDLRKDFQDLLDLIHQDKINTVFKNHLANDGAFVTVVIYLQGLEWADLADTVCKMPKVQEFEQYLTNAGIPIDKLHIALHDIIATAVPGTEANDSNGLTSFLQDLSIAFPLDDFITLLYKKIQTSSDMQEFYKTISSSEAKNLVTEIGQLAEVKRLKKRLIDLQVPIDDIIAEIYSFLGWNLK